MLTLVKNIGHALYRIWFFLLVALPMLIFSLPLFLATINPKTYHIFYWMARTLWATPILYGMGLVPKITWGQKMQKGKSYMLISNHTSMVDIMLMLYVSKNPFVFVGKKELEKLPVFGFFYKRVCILVDRKNPKSRAEVFKSVKERLNDGLSICIFPEGGVPENDVMLDNFKDGAFRMAIAHKIPIVPMTFLDCKKHFPWEFFSGYPGVLRVNVHRFIQTTNLEVEDSKTVRNQIRNMVLRDLIEKGIQ